jgi:hypothetical protein
MLFRSLACIVAVFVFLVAGQARAQKVLLDVSYNPSLIVLIPLGAAFLKTFARSWAQFGKRLRERAPWRRIN